MSPIRKLLFVGVGVLALHGLQACASETELNPQPLPPQSGGGDPAPADPGEKTGDMSSGSSGNGGSSGTPTSVGDAAADADAGATDAADAGDQ